MSMKIGRTLGLLVCLTGLVGAQVTRPNAVWFNKVIGMDRSRQLYVALHDSMWVMYDLPQAVLFQAWKGGATGGAFITGNIAAATPQYWFFTSAPQFPHVYRPSGATVFKDSVAEFFASYTNPAHVNTTTYYTTGKWPKQPILPKWGGTYRSWSVRNGSGQTLNTEVRHRAYFVTTGNVITLKYALILPDNAGEITVTESPEYSNQPSGHRLVRTFTFTGVPANHQVRLERLGGANPAAWSVTSGQATIAEAAMVQTSNGQTVLTGSF